MTARPPIAVVHLDESCLGNGREGANPGGAGSLIEVRTTEGVQRRDLYLHDPDTTNNRMALAGATATLDLLAGKNNRFRLVIVSDSQYLVKGITVDLPMHDPVVLLMEDAATEPSKLRQMTAEQERVLSWLYRPSPKSSSRVLVDGAYVAEGRVHKWRMPTAVKLLEDNG